MRKDFIVITYNDRLRFVVPATKSGAEVSQLLR